MTKEEKNSFQKEMEWAMSLLNDPDDITTDKAAVIEIVDVVARMIQTELKE